MNITVWNECYISGGADWSLIDLITSWPRKDDNFIIYINKSHEGLDLIKSKTNGHAQIRTFMSLNEAVEGVIGSIWIKRLPMVLKNQIRRILLIFFLLASPFIYWSLISKKECNILLLNNGGYPGGLSNYIVSVIARLKNIPKRYMIVRNYPYTDSKFISFTNVICNFALTKLIVVSDSLRKAMVQNTTIREDLFLRIHNGISIENKLSNGQMPGISWEYGYNLSAAIIGTLEQRKGHEILFKAWAEIINSVPGAKLFVIGSSSSGNKNRLVKLADDLEISESLVWVDYVNDISEFYKHLDVIVMPSQNFESFGRVSVEAMAFKIPIVASRVGGIPEIIEHGKDGFLFKHDDSQELAKTVIELFSSGELRDKIGSRGFEKYRENFTSEIMARNYFELVASDLSD